MVKSKIWDVLHPRAVGEGWRRAQRAYRQRPRSSRRQRIVSNYKLVLTITYSDLLNCNLHYALWPHFSRSKFQKWYQKLPSCVCTNTQKYYQAEANTLGAIFVSGVEMVELLNTRICIILLLLLVYVEIKIFLRRRDSTRSECAATRLLEDAKRR